MTLHDIGYAVNMMKAGKRVTREGWNGKGQYLVYMRELASGAFVPGQMSTILPHVMICTVGGKYVPWVCSQTDLLAQDWSIFGENES